MSDFMKGVLTALLGLWVLVSVGWFVIAIGFAGGLGAALSPPDGPDHRASFYFSWFIIIGPWLVIAFLLVKRAVARRKVG